MDKALRSVAASTFGFSSSRSSGKGKTSKASKASRDFIEKEKLIIKKEEEITQVSQQSSLNDSDGQSYGTSEEETEIECSQQQSEQGVSIGMVGDACFIGQTDKCDGQASIAIQEDDALPGDENCQQQCGQEITNDRPVGHCPVGEDEIDFQKTSTTVEENCQQQCGQETSPKEPIRWCPVETSNVDSQQTSTNVDTCVQNTQNTTEACNISTQIITVDKIVPVEKKHDVAICQQSQQQSEQCKNEVVETCCTTQVTKSVDVTEVICTSTGVCTSQKTDTKITCQQSQQDLSINGSVQECFAEKDSEIKMIACGTQINDTQDKVVKKTVDACDNSLQCGVGQQTWEKENTTVNTKNESTQSVICNTTETQQDYCKKSIITTTTEETHKIQACHAILMSVEATSRNTGSNKIEEDTEVLITAQFVNPLPTSLTNGKFWIEADNLVVPYCFEIPEIDAGETVICRALIYPQCAGYEFIVAKFTSCEIKKIVGFTNIRISRAISCESTKKVVPCKKM